MKRMSVSDKVVTIVNYVLCFIIACITAYPLIYVFSMSISRPEAVVSGTVKLLPKGFSLQAFKLVFSNMEVWRSYYNTIWYTVVGTAISVLLTLMAAYPLSRKQFCLRKPLSVFFSISMFFTGTLVPMYLLINNLGLYNTRWAIVLPTGAAAYYIIIARTFFSGISDSLYDSARIDGAGEMQGGPLGLDGENQCERGLPPVFGAAPAGGTLGVACSGGNAESSGGTSEGAQGIGNERELTFESSRETAGSQDVAERKETSPEERGETVGNTSGETSGPGATSLPPGATAQERESWTIAPFSGDFSISI